MPLRRGRSNETISDNVRKLMHEGHSAKRAIAIALSHARKSSTKRRRTRKSMFISAKDSLMKGNGDPATDPSVTWLAGREGVTPQYEHNPQTGERTGTIIVTVAPDTNIKALQKDQPEGVRFRYQVAKPVQSAPINQPSKSGQPPPSGARSVVQPIKPVKPLKSSKSSILTDRTARKLKKVGGARPSEQQVITGRKPGSRIETQKRKSMFISAKDSLMKAASEPIVGKAEKKAGQTLIGEKAQTLAPVVRKETRAPVVKKEEPKPPPVVKKEKAKKSDIDLSQLPKGTVIKKESDIDLRELPEGTTTQLEKPSPADIFRKIKDFLKTTPEGRAAIKEGGHAKVKIPSLQGTGGINPSRDKRLDMLIRRGDWTDAEYSGLYSKHFQDAKAKKLSSAVSIKAYEKEAANLGLTLKQYKRKIGPLLSPADRYVIGKMFYPHKKGKEVSPAPLDAPQKVTPVLERAGREQQTTKRLRDAPEGTTIIEEKKKSMFISAKDSLLKATGDTPIKGSGWEEEEQYTSGEQEARAKAAAKQKAELRAWEATPEGKAAAKQGRDRREKEARGEADLEQDADDDTIMEGELTAEAAAEKEARAKAAAAEGRAASAALGAPTRGKKRAVPKRVVREKPVVEKPVVEKPVVDWRIAAAKKQERDYGIKPGDPRHKLSSANPPPPAEAIAELKEKKGVKKVSPPTTLVKESDVKTTPPVVKYGTPRAQPATGSKGGGHAKRGPSTAPTLKSIFISAKDSLNKGVLSTKDREKLKQKQFALPKRADDKEEKAESGNYPIPDLSHARNALAMVAQHGTPSEQAKVRAAVYKKYPELDKRKEEEQEKSMFIFGPDKLKKGKKETQEEEYVGHDEKYDFVQGEEAGRKEAKKEEREEEKKDEKKLGKSLDPALAARQNMQPMSVSGPMGSPVIGQVGFHNSAIAANFNYNSVIDFETKVIPVLRRPRN